MLPTNDKLSICVHPPCVMIMSGRLEGKRVKGRKGTKSVNTGDEIGRRGVQMYCLLSTMVLVKCSFSGLSINPLSPCLSIILSLFCSLLLKQSPRLCRPQPALRRRGARPLLCGQSRLSDYCSVIVSKWTPDWSN